MPVPGVVAYAASKHAVVGRSLALRAEAAAAGVRVSVLCPGLVHTAILVNGGRYYGKVYGDLTPEQQLNSVEAMRLITPAQFARQALDAIARNQASSSSLAGGSCSGG